MLVVPKNAQHNKEPRVRVRPLNTLDSNLTEHLQHVLEHASPTLQNPKNPLPVNTAHPEKACVLAKKSSFSWSTQNRQKIKVKALMKHKNVLHSPASFPFIYFQKTIPLLFSSQMRFHIFLVFFFLFLWYAAVCEYVVKKVSDIMACILDNPGSDTAYFNLK